jgi:hypothetical protein
MRPRHVEGRAQPLEQGRFAGHEPRVDQRKQELGVVHLQLRDLRRLANLVTDHEAGVPQRVQDAPQEPLFGVFDGPVEQDEQIHVGERAEVAPPVAADRDERGRPPRRNRLRMDPAQLAIDVVAEPAERRGRRLAGQDVAADVPARVVETRAGRPILVGCHPLTVH